MKIRMSILILTLSVLLVQHTRQDDLIEEDDDFMNEEGSETSLDNEDEEVHETNEGNPARQTVDVNVPMPNHDIKNSFVVNLNKGEIIDLQAITGEFDLSDEEEEEEHLKKKMKKLKKQII